MGKMEQGVIIGPRKIVQSIKFKDEKKDFEMFLYGNLLHYIPTDACLVEPFDNGEIPRLFPDNKWKKFPRGDALQEELSVAFRTRIDYKGWYVFTRPPYKYINRAGWKAPFEYYKQDELYKCFLTTISECEGGILLLPFSFLVGKEEEAIRRPFFEKFEIKEINFFQKQLYPRIQSEFCSFFFQKKTGNNPDNEMLAHYTDEGVDEPLVLEEKYGYRFAGEFYDKYDYDKKKVIFRTYGMGIIFNNGVENNEGYLTNIRLFMRDRSQSRLRMEIVEEPPQLQKRYGEYPFLICKERLTKKQMEEAVEYFNTTIEENRKKYHNLILSRERIPRRRKISSLFACKIISYPFVCDRDEKFYFVINDYERKDFGVFRNK